MNQALKTLGDEGRQFDSFVSAYSAARPEYPRQVFDRMVLQHGGRFHCAVDIGCGTGQSLAGLDQIARHLIGVDPSPLMLAEAKRRVPHARFVLSSGEETNLPSESVDLVSIATAFHWMDQKKAIREARRILRPGGLFSVYRYDIPKLGGAAGEAFERRLQRDWRPFISDKILFATDPFEFLAQSAQWGFVSRTIVPFTPHYPAQQFVELMLATSYVQGFLAEHEDPAHYEHDLLKEFERFESEGLRVNLDIKLLMAVRNA